MRVPWWGKILAKVVLSRIPVGYRMFAALGLFRHGQMDDPDYAIRIFLRHFERSGVESAPGGWDGLELGVGDSVASALIASSYSARKVYLVDSGSYAKRDISIYRTMNERLEARGLPSVNLDGVQSFEEVLAACDSTYLVDDLDSLRGIPTDSVDFIWSNAVLEHIRREDFASTMIELCRILKPGGVMSHRVDLKDHLGGKLNNRRISSRLWEKDWFASSGFYTNRLAYCEMTQLFKSAGLSVDVVQIDHWDTLPTPRQKMAKEFQSLSTDDLLVSGFDVLLRSKEAWSSEVREIVDA